jgi:Protein of unknown function (DUF3574)
MDVGTMVMMERTMFEKVALIALPLSLLIAAPTYTGAQAELAREQAFIRRPIPEGARNRAASFARTELFFGTAKPDGVVTPEEFQSFIDQEVTPRFPDGLTILDGRGQFRTADGVLVKENSFVLLLMYPAETANESTRKIERIRRLYAWQFQQESVLRVDDPFGVWVSF